MLLATLAILVGFVLGFVVPYEIPQHLSVYTAIVILACLDSVFSGLKADLRKEFNFDSFCQSFFINVIVALILILFGGKFLGIYLESAIIILYVFRLFRSLTDVAKHFCKTKDNI